MQDGDLAFKSAVELRELVRAKEASPVELTSLYLQRIGDLDPKLNSYLTVSADQAMSAAKEAEQAVVRGDDLGPLHGLPVSVKDLELTKGIRTTSGSLAYKDRIPKEDSIVVERVKKAGGVILGKTNTPEFGLLGHTENRLGDHCRNPWNTDRTTGGSSGGAGASLAAGLCALATGSDGGGSIRLPASFCGVYGIKPTQNRVPYYSGSAPAVINIFSQAGPMSRTVRDSAMLLQVLAGHDHRDRGSLRDAPDDYLAAADRGVSGLRIAWSPDFGYAPVDDEVARTTATAAKAFEEMGATVEETDLDVGEPFDAFWDLFSTISLARAGAFPEEHHDELTWYGKETYERGAGVSGQRFALALGEIEVLKAKFADLFGRYDLLLSPTLATTAFPVGTPPKTIGGKPTHWFWGYLPFTYPINMIGNPAASVPCGFSLEGLPIGLHIVGRRGDEPSVIAASAAYEEAYPWAHHRPPTS